MGYYMCSYIYIKNMILHTQVIVYVRFGSNITEWIYWQGKIFITTMEKFPWLYFNVIELYIEKYKIFNDKFCGYFRTHHMQNINE